jgi:hypothetical protein
MDLQQRLGLKDAGHFHLTSLHLLPALTGMTRPDTPTSQKVHLTDQARARLAQALPETCRDGTGETQHRS